MGAIGQPAPWWQQKIAFRTIGGAMLGIMIGAVTGPMVMAAQLGGIPQSTLLGAVVLGSIGAAAGNASQIFSK